MGVSEGEAPSCWSLGTKTQPLEAEHPELGDFYDFSTKITIFRHI